MRTKGNELKKAQVIVRNILNGKKVNPSKPVFTGIKYVEKPGLQLFEYNKENVNENSDYDVSDFNGFPEDELQHWLNIHGIHDIDVVTLICEKLNIHSLVVQDILDIDQRPKFQEFEDYCFFTLKSIPPTEKKGSSIGTIEFYTWKKLPGIFPGKKRRLF